MSVSVVGIGYGADVTGEVRDVLARADVVIGHESFIAAVRHLVRAGAECFDVQAMATATEDIFAVRARAAVERDLKGAHVVIVSGGDPGLLGMAGPFLRGLYARAREDRPVEDVRILPGLSAWQYASARLGAPFNGGVCVLSLCLYSHTETKILRQIKGVAASGLGLVAYMLRHNGEMKPERYPTPEPAVDLARRRFVTLRDELLRHRDPRTPAFLVRGLGEERDGKPERAPLAECLGLWERSDAVSVFCVPGDDYEEGGDFIWNVT
ncbi:SAM-dependent methyltransferase [Streptomyces sp. 150FB]|uniref:SAM-dependent methyltransferase n=1 Tax=Streptomyces sp. 150FB TaxID=1576605 RepID=UPI00099E0DA4|nr:SAM-dependent methyltransferase [Streptomyces sp. 150FB]